MAMFGRKRSTVGRLERVENFDLRVIENSYKNTATLLKHLRKAILTGLQQIKRLRRSILKGGPAKNAELKRFYNYYISLRKNQMLDIKVLSEQIKKEDAAAKKLFSLEKRVQKTGMNTNQRQMRGPISRGYGGRKHMRSARLF